MLPTFLNPWMAAWAAALAIPALVLLYFLKLRRQSVPVASTLLWKKAVQDLQVNSPFQRLRRNLLLLLQLLALLALLLAFARPVSEAAVQAGPRSVILIDRSASMSAGDSEDGSRLEEAKRRAKELIDTVPRGGESMVIAFDDTARIIQPLTSDKNALRNAVDSITPTDRPTRLKTALSLADAQLSFFVEELRPSTTIDVHLFSDGNVADEDELSLRGNLVYHPVGTTDAPNVAITQLSFKRNYERPTEVQVFASLANYGIEPRTTDVRLSVAEIDPDNPSGELNFVARRTPAGVSLPPARWSDPAWAEANQEAIDPNFPRRDGVEFRLDLTQGAVLKLEHLAEGEDVLSADDVAYVVVPPPDPLRVLLVTEGNFFLEKLLETQNLRDPAIITPAQYEEQLPQDYDVILFDAYSPAKLPPAGSFVYSGGLPPDAKLGQLKTEAGLGLFYEDSEVLDWQRDHPMLAGINLNRLWVAEGFIADVPLDATMLIEGVKAPLLILWRDGPRTHLVFTFDLNQSTWPQQLTFPLFWYQMFEYLAVAEDVGVAESLTPGQQVEVPRLALERADLGEENRLALVGPNGRQSVSVPANGPITLPTLDEVGVYSTDPPLPQFAHLAVSLLSPNESELAVSETPPGNFGQTAVAAGAEGAEEATRQVEWWWWLVLAVVVPMLMIEWWVYTRRLRV